MLHCIKSLIAINLIILLNQQLMMAAAAAAGQQQGGPGGTGQAQANLTHAGLVGQQLGLPQNQQVFNILPYSQ